MKEKYTFDNFIVHEGNKVAFTAIQKIAERPGDVLNPFFVFGPEGFGKTHLLTALSNVLRQKGGVDFLTGQEFEEELGKRRKFGSPLIVDDIDEIGDTRKKILRGIIENALRDNIQVCFSSSVPPGKIEGFSKKLCSLLESGLVCELTSPESTARIDIIRGKAADAGIILSDDVLEQISLIATGSVGAIESMVKRLVTYSSLGNFAIDPGSIALILKDFFPRKSADLVPSMVSPTPAEDIESLENVESADLRDEFEKRVLSWENKGFDVSELRKVLPDDSLELRRKYHDFAQKAARLLELQEAFASVDREQSPELALRIDSIMFDPARVGEVEESLKEFGERGQGSKEYRKFNEFIIGFCNKLVYDAYRDKVLDNLGASSPFVIFGERGTGKSHFLEAVCDDLVSRKKRVLLIDLASTVKADASVDAYDILAIDNFDAVLGATESTINDVEDLINGFRKASKQVIITSVPLAENVSLPAALDGVLEGGVSALLERPSADVVREYIRRHAPADAADLGERSVPEFDSFYDIAYYLQTLSDEGPAVVPLGLPGEEEVCGPAAAVERTADAEPVGRGASRAPSPDIVIGENFLLPEIAGELIEEGY